MKRAYEKPMVEIEEFQLNESIAACDQKVTFGPDDTTGVCGDYGFGGDPFARSMKIEPFYENGCMCYYTAPKGSGYFGNS